MDEAREQEVTVLPIVLHGRLVKILADAGARRGKSVPQLISDAILEKADTLYYEDHPEEKRGG
jgi:hypothetical protein